MKPTHFLSIELKWFGYKAVGFGQTITVDKIFKSNIMKDCNILGSAMNPIVDDGEVQNAEPLLMEDHHHYWSIDGSVIYTVNKSKPFLALAASVVSSYTAALTGLSMHHWKGMLRYQSLTKEITYIVSPWASTQLNVHVNASWGARTENNDTTKRDLWSITMKLSLLPQILHRGISHTVPIAWSLLHCQKLAAI